MSSLQKEKPPKPPPTLLPIQVECVVSSLDTQTDPILAEVRSFCQEKRAQFQMRVYDSYRSRYDRDQIERLPAFHIFVNQRYEKTFYPNGRPFQVIYQVIEAYNEAVQRRLQKKQRFRTMLTNLKQKLQNLFHRKTRMEKYQEEQKAQQLERTSTNSLQRRRSLVDWE